MSNDVIKGPGEYRTRDGDSVTVLAIMKGKAVGYRIVDGKLYAADWQADTGHYIEGQLSDSDILPPAPVIDGPGRYEMRNGRLMHVAVVKDGTAFGFYESDKGGLFDSNWNSETGAFANSFSPFDVIGKLVNP